MKRITGIVFLLACSFLGRSDARETSTGLEFKAAKSILSRIADGTPAVMYESYDYEIQITNNGDIDLTNAEFVYSINFRTEGKNPERKEKEIQEGIGAKATAVAKLIPRGASMGFITMPIDLSYTPRSGERNVPYEAHSKDIPSWRETLTGIVIETLVNGKVVDVFEHEETPDSANVFRKRGSPKSGGSERRVMLRDYQEWSGKNGQKLIGKFLYEANHAVHILSKRGITKIAKHNLSAETKARYESMRSCESLVRPLSVVLADSRRPAGEEPRSSDVPDTVQPEAPAPDEKPSGELYNPLVWRGKNGEEFTGTFVKEERNILHIRHAESGDVMKIAKYNLSTETLAWYETEKAKTSADKRTVVDANSPYQPIDDLGLKRDKIPVLNQSEYGTKASDCLPNSYSAFFLWWDQSNLIAIPKGRDFEAKAQWIHRELSIRCGTRNNSGTSFVEMKKGLQGYFDEFHPKQFKINIETVTNVSPASLAKYTSGMNATVLSLSTYQGKRIRRGNAGFHAVTLINAQEDGRIELATWGGHLTGKMSPLLEEEIPKTADIAPDAPRVIYEIIFDEDCDFPRGFKEQNFRFVIDPSNYSRLHVLSVQELKKK